MPCPAVCLTTTMTLLTNDHIAVIDGALTISDGRITEAVAYLNDQGWDWDKQKLRKTIDGNEFLREKWSKKDAQPIPIEVTDIDRPVHIDDAEPEQIVTALQNQECELRSTLNRLGFNGSALETALAARDLQSKFSVATLAMMGGGITDVFFKLKSEVGQILEEIRPADSSQKPVHDREAMLRDNLVDLVNSMHGCHDRAMKALMLEVEAKTKAREKGKRPRGMLGVTAMAGSTVQVLQK